MQVLPQAPRKNGENYKLNLWKSCEWPVGQPLSNPCMVTNIMYKIASKNRERR